MERVVFFGKGGIGKSTTASNISATLAASGRRVLHVGCDPKHDSTVALLRGSMIDPVVDRVKSLEGLTAESVVTRSHLGVDCVEAGGPEAGVGCGGRGISRMLEIFKSVDLLSPARYDVCVYDVLGDVVCGGFASPLRKGIGEKVVIVASEEVMALYAANNIARAVCHYASNGVYLAGLIVNLRDNAEDTAPVERFAKLINTRVLGYIPRDPIVREAEYRRMTVAEHAPGAPITQVLRALGEEILALDVNTLPLPTPLDETTFYALTQHRFAVPEGGVGRAPPPAPPSAPSLISLRRDARDDEAHRAERQRQYESERHAGLRAVRLGRVSADEAARRLREAYPRESQGLRGDDLAV